MQVLAYGSGYAVPHGLQPVRALQRRLAGLGYSPGPIDGRYGPMTQGAVIRFQTAHGLTADGIAGARTLAALATARPVLYPGEGYGRSGSNAVRSLQRHLAAAGFSPGPIDGRYGPRTAQAVTRFQLARHLRVDGIAGPQTLGHLKGRPTTRRQHHVASERPASRRRPRPAPAPSSPPRHVTPVPEQRRQPERHPASFPFVWVILFTALLLGFLLRQLWHWRGATGREPVAPRVPVPPPEAEAAGTPDQDRAAAFRLGLLLAEEGDRVGAEDAFRRADERGHAAAAFELGVLLVEEGDRAGAKEAFLRAEERGHPDAAFDLGALLLQDGDRAGAEEAFRRADQRGDGGAACNLGVLLEQRGDLAGAKAAYQRADKRGHGVGACNLGALLEHEGDVMGAKAAYQRAEGRGDSIAAYHLGMLLEREGDRAGAKAAYRRADQRGHPEGTCNLGLLLKDEGDRDGAVHALQRAGESGSPEVEKVARAALVELDPNEEGNP